MKENIIAMRYASGLMKLAMDRNDLEQVTKDLSLLADMLDYDSGEINVPELMAFLGSPIIPRIEKITLTDIICKKLGIGKTVSDLLNVLIEKRRVKIINLIEKQFAILVTEVRSVQQATIEAGQQLSDEQVNSIKKALEKATGKKVDVKVKVLTRLLGGARIYIQNRQIDGTLRSRLFGIRKQIKMST